MYTDMVGYTALGQKNESLSLTLVEEQRNLIRPILQRHNGREVKTMGDAFLVEFENALDAVRCSYDIQRASREFNIARPYDLRIRLRVGVHLGDVEESNGDIFGDAVNVASRIEPLAEDGGVCLTRQVHDQVQNKIGLPFLNLGTKPLKNVKQLTEVYKMVMPWDEKSASGPLALDKKRIAILPFANISPDPADEYFADGMTEELISTMSNVGGLKVIARTSVMGYKGGLKKVVEIAKELEVGTVLEGSVRKAGNKLRITVQLVDSRTSDHLWAESYDREFQDVFSVQSDIARKVSDVLRVKLLASEENKISRKPTESMDAYILYLNGRQQWVKRDRDSIMKAIDYFSRALDHDDSFALAYAGLADSYMVSHDHYDRTAETLEKAMRMVLKALELDETLAEAHSTYAMLLSKGFRWEEAETEIKRAIELNPNYATAHQYCSFLLTTEGRLDEALNEAKKALGLDPQAPVMSYNVGRVLFALERWDEAIEYGKRSLAIDPNFPYSLSGMMAAYNMKNEFDQAMAWWKKGTYGRSAGDPPQALALIDLATIQARAGERDRALENLNSAMRIQDSEREDAFGFAVAFAALHDEDKALHWLEKAAKESQPGIEGSIVWNPFFKDLRSNPRFQEILKKLGLEKT